MTNKPKRKIFPFAGPLRGTILPGPGDNSSRYAARAQSRLLGRLVLPGAEFERGSFSVVLQVITTRQISTGGKGWIWPRCIKGASKKAAVAYDNPSFSEKELTENPTRPHCLAIVIVQRGSARISRATVYRYSGTDAGLAAGVVYSVPTLHRFRVSIVGIAQGGRLRRLKLFRAGFHDDGRRLPQRGRLGKRGPRTEIARGSHRRRDDFIACWKLFRKGIKPGWVKPAPNSARPRDISDLERHVTFGPTSKTR